MRRIFITIFLIVRSEDRRISVAQSRALYVQAPNPKSLWVVEGARHGNLHQFAMADYERRILDFFRPYLTVVR